MRECERTVLTVWTQGYMSSLHNKSINALQQGVC
jgi:hypothetical protein